MPRLPGRKVALFLTLDHHVQVYYLEGFHNNMPEEGEMDDGDVRLGRWFKLLSEYWADQGAVKREEVEDENSSDDITEEVKMLKIDDDVHTG